MGDGRRRDHVGRTRADGRRARHHAPAVVRLGIGDGGVRHGLLVMGAIGGESIPQGIKRLPKARHIAVTEDCEDAGEQSGTSCPSISLYWAPRNLTSA